MKNTLKTCAAACGLFVSVIAASAAPVVDTADFALRQLWPWSGQIVAEFTVSGSVTAPGATATLAAYDGETFLCDIPLSAATGDIVISSVGRKRIKIDPTKVPGLAGRGTLKDFRLGIAYVDATLDYNSAGVLYVVFDLTKKAGEEGFETVLTESDLTGGSMAREGVGPYGAWKRQYWRAGADTVAWLDVTNDVYKTTKLVFRHIPAQTFTMGSPATEPGRLPNENYNGYATQKTSYGLEDVHAVTLSGYYLGVFELTQKQWELCGNAARANGWFTKGDAVPANTITVAEIRGSDTPTDAVGTGSFMGKLAALVGDGWSFDLPTEAQWEAACRAGTATGLYDGTDLPAELTYYTLDNREGGMREIVYEPLANLAIFFNGKKEVPVTTVGTKLPNNYGLYDMLGNAGEICRDRIEANKGLGAAATTDPLTAKGSVCLRGGTSDNYITYNYGLAPLRAAARAVIANVAVRQYGFRVQMTAPAVAEAPATDAPAVVASATCRVDTGAGTTLLGRTLGGGAVTLAWELPDEAATTRLTLASARTSQELTFAAGVTSYVWTVSAPTDETNERAYTLTLAFEKDGAPLAGTELVATGIGVVRGVGASGMTHVYANGTANRRWLWIHGANHATVPLLSEDITSLTVDGAAQAIAVPGWYDLTVPYDTSRTLSLVTPTDTTDVVLTARPTGTLLLIR